MHQSLNLKKKTFCECYHIRIKTAMYIPVYLPRRPVSNNKQQSKIFLIKKKKSLNKLCSLNQHYHYLKFKYMQLRSHHSPLPKHKPLLLFHIVLLHISSQVKCYSSQFLEAPRAAEKHMRSSRARWPSPGSGAAPQAEHLTVTTETDGHTHMNREHLGQNMPHMVLDIW